MMYDDKCCEISDESSDDQMTYTLDDEVWHAAVQIFQLAMFTQQDVSDVFQSLRVESRGDRMVLTAESRKGLTNRLHEVSESLPPIQDVPSDDTQVLPQFTLVKG